MPFVILSVIVQIALVVHVMRNGRPVYWIYLIVFMPVAQKEWIAEAKSSIKRLRP